MSEEIKSEVKHSCENHERCMEMIQAVLDGSATKEELDHFRNEMTTCLPCIEGHELQKSIKEALNIKLEKKCCPKSTVSKIREHLGIASLLIAFAIIEIKLIHHIF
jgi:hypothetical protein